MKIKALSLIAIVALVTLSFTFASVKTKNTKKNIETKSSSVVNDGPIGGFAIEDKL
jgi:hypothetical protein